jgi:uracil phosphoribosyltransferase
MRILVEDALAELPSRAVTVKTPCGSFPGIELCTDKLCAISIVRSGDALLDTVRECIPSIPVVKILIQRNEASEAKEPHLFFVSKLPDGIQDMNILLCDPMLATGGSAKCAIQALVTRGVSTERVIFANMIACPEGLRALAEEYPQVKIVTACIDEGLNDDKFIVPGLGDYGDRFFNTA